MKRLAIALSVVFLAFGAAIVAQVQSESVEQELLKLEQDWTNADLKGDMSVFDRISAEDYILTDSDGNVWTKAQCLSLGKSGEDVITSWASDDWKVRVYRDAAVVTARHTVKETFKGKDVSGQLRTTNTWVKLSGRWQCVATHSSRIAQKQSIGERTQFDPRCLIRYWSDRAHEARSCRPAVVRDIRTRPINDHS